MNLQKLYIDVLARMERRHGVVVPAGGRVATVAVAVTYLEQIDRARERVEAARSMVMGQTRGSYFDDSIYIGPQVNPGALYYEGRLLNRTALFQQVQWHEAWLRYGNSLNDREERHREGSAGRGECTSGAEAFEREVYRRSK